MDNFKRLKQVVAALTVLLLFCAYVSGCSPKNNATIIESTSSNIETELTTEKIVESITESIQNANNAQITPFNISYNYEDYVGDMDALVYGLIMNEYELVYNVFNAALELPDGSIVYGIGYTDFEDYFESDDGIGFFPAGFIAFIGEPDIPENVIENGLRIIDLDYDESEYAFVYAYEPSEHMEHCVVWGKYLKYGVDSKGKITYSAKDYVREGCDETLGTLYSYDDERFLYDPDVGNYQSVSGLSLNQAIDYSALEAEINELLENQDHNLSYQEIVSSIHIAHEAVNSYFLSKQEETFMNIKVSELIEISKNLDPMECVRITPNGVIVFDAENDIPHTPDALTKWIVGYCCVQVVAACIALDIFVPALLPITGAISGMAVEIFCQVVLENQTVDNINWAKVAVAAVSGALLAWACPMLASGASKGVVKVLGKTISAKSLESIAKLAGYATLTLSNAVVSGTTNAAFAVIDGKSQEDVVDSFLIGAAIAAGCTAAVSALSEVIEKVGPKVIENICKKTPNSWYSKLSDKIDKASAFIGDHQIHFKNQKIEDILVPKSVYQTTKCAIKELEVKNKISYDKIDRFISDDNLNFIKIDSMGKKLSKSDLIENGGNCIVKLADDCDDELRRLFEESGITELKMIDGVIDLSPISIMKFKPQNGISANRKNNMNDYYKQLRDMWKGNPDVIPGKIREVLSEDDIINLTWTKVKEALSKASITPHEGVDGYVYLVDTYIHNKISHYGGVALAKAQAMLITASTNIDQLIRSNVTVVYGAFVA